VRLDADWLINYFQTNRDTMRKEKFDMDPKGLQSSLKDTEAFMMQFLTKYLFSSIGSSKTLIIVRGVNIDSFTMIIANLAGYIKKKKMQIKIMTIVSTDYFAANLINDKKSFA